MAMQDTPAGVADVSARSVVADARALLDRWNSGTGGDGAMADELAVALAGVLRLLDGEQFDDGWRAEVQLTEQGRAALGRVSAAGGAEGGAR